MPRVAIIGTAGRKPYTDKMSKSLYFQMVREAIWWFHENINPLEEINLQSGGAAWSDHVAVSIYLMYKNGTLPLANKITLDLHLPAPYENGAFIAGDNWRSPGSTSNYYHRLFRKRCGGNPVAGIGLAASLGARLHIHHGFKVRNIPVGRADILLAYTWGSGTVPADGGTKHTWSNSNAPIKIHFPLEALQLEDNRVKAAYRG